MKDVVHKYISSFSEVPGFGQFLGFLGVSVAPGHNFQANFRAAAQSKYTLSGAKHSPSPLLSEVVLRTEISSFSKIWVKSISKASGTNVSIYVMS